MRGMLSSRPAAQHAGVRFPNGRAHFVPTAAYGGGRGRGRGSGDQDLSALILGGPAAGTSKEFQEHLAKKKLIIPGGGSRPSQPQQGGAPPQQGIIMPEEAGRTFAGVLDASDSVSTPTPPSRYRPPAGFMDETLHADETANMPAQEMLRRLQAKAAKWHTLAKFIPSLYKQNYDSSVIDEMTGITPLEQNKWVVAGTVYDSLKLSGKVPPAVLNAFDEGGDDLLIPFRFLGVDARVAAALYLVANRLEPRDCEVLARSMKEWERRVTERNGFSEHPGDCLAFKYLRDAMETRNPREMAQRVEQGIAVAVTDGARARLRELIETKEETKAKGLPTTTGVMTLIRLNEFEIGFRALPLLGSSEKVCAADVRSAPTCAQEGLFGAFAMSGVAAPTCRWVALPQWTALTQARHPIALEVSDCSKVTAIQLGTKVKTDEDRKRLQGPGLLVLECGPVSAADAKPELFYLTSAVPVAGAPEAKDRLELVDGTTLAAAGKSSLATLLFLCRPPVREGMAASETNNLLQL